MEDGWFYPIALWSMYVLALMAFLSLRVMQAPYGRHIRRGYGTTVAAREAWIIFESPTLFVMVIVFHFGQHNMETVPNLLLRFHQLHFVHRCIIYPFRMRAEGKPSVPMAIILHAIALNVLNTYVQGRWISHYGNYTSSWLTSPQFLMGALLFFSGAAINIWADNVLLNLRADSHDHSYKIPRGFLYDYVTCPNYLGEMIEWFGWAMMTNSFAGLAFFVYCVANLGPRAVDHHKWYLKKFNNYPRDRKILVPFLF